MPEALNTTEAPTLERRFATVAPASLDEAKRTVEVVFATGAPVRRFDMAGVYQERLAMTEEAADLSRLQGGSVLNGHRRQDLRDQLGVVEQAEIRDGRGVATLRIARSADWLLEGIKDGIYRKVSVGYSIGRTSESKDPSSGERVKTVDRWAGHEISFVPIPADPAATVRSETMPDPIEPQPAPEPSPPPQADAARAQVDENIRAMAAGWPQLGEDFATRQIEARASEEEARAAALAELQRQAEQQTIRTQAVPQIIQGGSGDAPEARAERMAEALDCRMNPDLEPSAAAREFLHNSCLDYARLSCRHAGISTTGLSPGAILERALHSTSDFPLLFESTFRRQLRRQYVAYMGGVDRLARQGTTRDFREQHFVQTDGHVGGLAPVPEGGEYEQGTFEESGESIRLATYGRIFSFTRQMMVNDDLGAMTRASQMLSRAVAVFVKKQLVDKLTEGSGLGPVMADGLTLFHADHGNLAGAGAAPDVATIAAARLAMRKQTGLDGELIEVAPRFLLVPPELETAAEKVLSTELAPSTVAEVNPLAAKLQLIVDSRLSAKSATAWYVVSDPNAIDGLVYLYLDGAPGPQVSSKVGFEIDGTMIKVRIDFGCGFIDHRGWYRNAGA